MVLLRNGGRGECDIGLQTRVVSRDDGVEQRKLLKGFGIWGGSRLQAYPLEILE